MLRQSSKIDDDDIEEYQKTEIIRKAVADVKKRGAEQEERRKHPDTAVQSKVSMNMKTQKKVK